MLSSTLSNRWATLLSDPFAAIRREFERDALSGANGLQRQFAPLTLSEDDGHVYLHVDLPGLSRDDLELTMEQGRLWIRGERKAPLSGACCYDERTYGRFERVVRLSDTVDPGSIEATMEGGVLSVTFAKRPEAQPRRIEVNYRAGSQQKLTNASGQ
jgi:HSP20 family protein